MKTLDIQGIPIEFTRKRVRNLRLSISPRDCKVSLSMPFFASERQAVAFAESKIEWVKRTVEKIKKNPLVPAVEVNISAEEILELRDLIGRLIPEWEFRLGVVVKEWNLRKMKTRWGSCKTDKGKITFSISLAKKPLRCVEYVVAHELAHLLVPNHSKRFYAVVEKHFPFWRDVRGELNGK